jgi:hypothetical protein
VIFSAEVFNIKLVANLLNQLLFKFENFWLSRFSLVIKILALYPLKNRQNRKAVGDVVEVVEDVVVVVGDAVLEVEVVVVVDGGVTEAVGDIVVVARCGRTNLNYTGSSTRVLSGGLPRASNGIIPWLVG